MLGVILGAVYLTWMYQRVIFGPVTHEENRSLTDLSPREIAVFAPIVALVFFMGIYPKPLLSRMEPSIKKIVAQVESRDEKPRKQRRPQSDDPITEAKATTVVAGKAL